MFTINVLTLLLETASSVISSSAYDTAWIARLSEFDEEIGRDALDWLRTSQLSDGSWGAADIPYFHDRFICTLAAAISLRKYGYNGDEAYINRAKAALQTEIRQLVDRASVETIAFEMIVPILLAEAQSLDLIEEYSCVDINRLERRRASKLAALPDKSINRKFTPAFSAEMVGSQFALLDVNHLQERNGSLGNSPSATAYFAMHVDAKNPAALEYLRSIKLKDGSFPTVSPIDVFQSAWLLWNLSLVEDLDAEVLVGCQQHLDLLEAAWTPGQGVGPSAVLTPKDSDDTSVTFDVLHRYGRIMDVEAVLCYEEADYFRCYALEANPSVSANIHVLGALRAAGFDQQHPSVQKIVRFLQSAQYWQDKWHVSPYYATAHTIIVAAGYLNWIAADAVDWILSTQNPAGSWGYYCPTAEETAYCLQALVMWRRHGFFVDKDILKRGLDWLMEHDTPPYPQLWISKCLYTPTHVVQGTILSAELMVSQLLGR